MAGFVLKLYYSKHFQKLRRIEYFWTRSDIEVPFLELPIFRPFGQMEFLLSAPLFPHGQTRSLLENPCKIKKFFSLIISLFLIPPKLSLSNVLFPSVSMHCILPIQHNYCLAGTEAQRPRGQEDILQAWKWRRKG